MGAAPRKNVIRENSDPGDIIILLGGRTGRDGCGGATGSSKVHTTQLPSKHVVLKYRKVMHRQNVRSRDCSAETRSQQADQEM